MAWRVVAALGSKVTVKVAEFPAGIGLAGVNAPSVKSPEVDPVCVPVGPAFITETTPVAGSTARLPRKPGEAIAVALVASVGAASGVTVVLAPAGTIVFG